MKIELELKPYPENTPTTHIIPLLTAVQCIVTGGIYWDLNEYMLDQQCFPRYKNHEYDKVIAFAELPNVNELFKNRHETENQVEQIPRK